MEKATDKLNNENGSTAPRVPQAGKDSPVPTAEGAAEMSRAELLIENAADVKRLEFTEECITEMETPSGTERDSPDAFKPAILERDCPNSNPLIMLTNSNSPEVFGFEMNHQRSTTTSVDMDCLVCFNKYNIYRVPKLLDCGHAFCSLPQAYPQQRREYLDNHLPLCRKATFVSGGLIRTLQNKDDVMEHLENLDSNPEVPISAIGLDSNSWTQTSQDALHGEENLLVDNRLAVQRLVLLLLLVVILTILILPFIYSGLIKWVICLMLTLGLVMSMVLCCTPKFCWRCNRDSFTSCHKQTHIAAIA